MSHSLTPTFGACASGQIKAILRGCLAEREFAMTELIPKIYADALFFVVFRCFSAFLGVFRRFSAGASTRSSARPMLSDAVRAVALRW